MLIIDAQPYTVSQVINVLMYGRYYIYLAYGMTHADKKPKQTSLKQLLAGFFPRSGKSYVILESDMKNDTWS